MSESDQCATNTVEHQPLREGSESSKYGDFAREANNIRNSNSDDMHESRTSFKRGMKCMWSQTLFHCLLILLIALTFSMFILRAHSLRLSVTLVMGLVLALGSTYPCDILTQRWIVYLGDISYALYLVHWPAYVWMKFHCDRNLGGMLNLL
ncbi:hypothetical protein ANCCAN_04816 [Ancylostoma caninum]|uniref:Acyltransferase 3 domain-containing protein n=1 Tax=Ancylostoma caninum TaxID=29170 RepID=A0A368GXJ5_ANCCA|nr:hypothetical protein ANCCAN_04816 [Ancylostoma caninum]